MTAKDLLFKLYEYNFLWKSHANSEPSTIRKGQIECLLEAFKLSKNHINNTLEMTYTVPDKGSKMTRNQYLKSITNIEYFERGEFLKDRPYEEYYELSSKAIKKIHEIYDNIPNDRFDKPIDIKWMFNSLYSFRQSIYNLTYPEAGMLEGFSIGLIYSKLLQADLKKVIVDNLEEIDNTLWLILDPRQVKFTINDLERNYDYRNIDLSRIDLEWRMKNY